MLPDIPEQQFEDEQASVDVPMGSASHDPLPKVDDEPLQLEAAPAGPDEISIEDVVFIICIESTLDIGLGVLCGGKGTAPGCAHCVGAQRFQASSDEEASDSSGSNSDVSSQDDSSDVSDLEKFDEAYTDFSALTDGVDPQTLERFFFTA